MSDTQQAPLIRVEGLCKRFGEGEAAIDVLNGVDLVLEPGDRVAVVGQSGVGKSTLAACLAAARPASSHVLGDDLKRFIVHPPLMAPAA